jgi:biopolymer transport protein ExbD
MGAKLGSGGGPMADINVTPLIDVVLVLLVVFMVITPMLQSGMPVNLPEASTTTTVNDVGQFVVVSITKNGDLAVEQDRLDTDDDLVPAIIVKLRENPERVILIKADRRLEYARVREVMDLLTPQGWTALKIAAASEG